MKKKWKDDPWVPADNSWKENLPDVTGNEFNGLGEKEFRRPKQIFWHRKPEGKLFGEVQKMVTDRFNSVPALDEVYANADRGPRKLSSPSANRTAGTAEEWTKKIKDFVLNKSGIRPDQYPVKDCDAELVGITATDPAWFYDGYDPDLPFIIIIGNVMDHSRLSLLPGDNEQVEGQLEVADQYNRGARVSNYLSHWIRSHDYSAIPHAGPWAGSLNLVPAAVSAGLGELGNHGSIINRTYGSSFRIAAVETNIPLLIDGKDRFGADEFCLRCKVCANACPPQAIANEKEWVRGEYKWYVDFDKCLPYFNETFSCGICISVCPWSTPGRSEKLAKIWSQRIENNDETQ